MINLHSVRLFAGLSEDEVNSILAAAHERGFKASEAILRAERPASHLFLLKTGCVDYHIVTEKGKQILLRRFVPGNALGIASFLSEPVGYLGTATAVQDVEVLAWERRSVMQLAKAYPRLPQNAFRLALHYLAIYAQRHASLVSDTAQERMAFALTDVASRAGKVFASGVEINIRNQDLASLADISLFTASRLIKKWERSGAVEKRRGRVRIRCPEKLLAEESPMFEHSELH